MPPEDEFTVVRAFHIVRKDENGEDIIDPTLYDNAEDAQNAGEEVENSTYVGTKKWGSK